MHSALKIVYQYRCLNSVLLSAISRELQFLVKIAVGPIMFTRVWFTNINREKLKSLIAIAPVQFVQGRDLAHKRRSRDAAKFEQHMLYAAKCGESNPLTVETGQLKIGSLFSGAQ